MSDLTKNVARLYRAGSEHSKQWKKLNEAAVALVRWIGEHWPEDEELPGNCRITRQCSGPRYAFELYHDAEPGNVFTIRTWDRAPNSRGNILRFAEFIVEHDWLNKVSAALEAHTRKYEESVERIQSFLAPSENDLHP